MLTMLALVLARRKARSGRIRAGVVVFRAKRPIRSTYLLLGGLDPVADGCLDSRRDAPEYRFDCSPREARVKTFKDRIAVVTGAASGIGLALAERFAAEGMKIVMADIEATALATAEAALRRKAPAVLAVEVDVARPDDVERLARETYAAFGAAHVLCNNAGVAVIGAAHEHSLADWQWVINVNLWGVIHGVRAFLPRMLAGGGEGHIVNTASMSGLTTAPFMSVYDVTKHAVVALSESMYKEFALTGVPIGISVVCPGLIKTSIMQSARNRPPELAD